MQKPTQSIKLFQNPFLERFTHVHPITPLLVWGPIVAYLIWRSFVVYHFGLFEVSMIAVTAMISWTLAEYILHRYIFHFEGEHVIFKKFHFLMHGIHHADPQDGTRLVMVPTVSLILGAIHFALFRFFMGDAIAEPFFAFYVVGYLCYDYTHFAVHHFKPRTRFGKTLKQNHMHHHYIDHNARWGVSTPVWDYVFGTMDGENVNVGVKI